MKSLAALLVLMSLSIPVNADWDPALEAREQAEAKAAAERQAAIDKKNQATASREILRKEGIDTTEKSDEEVIGMLNARIQQSKTDAAQSYTDTMNDIRKQLGKAADGKSDDEVRLMYEKHNARLSQDLQQKAADTHDERDAAMQNMTGKSLEDLENMSDADMDKMAEELEKKYGQ